MIKLLPFFITCFVYSQIGINKTTPQATIDIVVSSEKTPLKVHDKNSDLKMQVDSNANFFFKNSLLINENGVQNPGKQGQVLMSNGPNKTPSWIDLESSVIGDYLTPILSANNTVVSPNNTSKQPNVEYPINFLLENVIFINGYVTPSLDMTLEPGINTGTNILTVEKRGVYSITFNSLLVAPNTSDDFKCMVYLGDYEHYFQGDKNNDEIQLVTNISRFLNVGDKIYITIEGPTSWGFKTLNFLMNYVKADN